MNNGGAGFIDLLLENEEQVNILSSPISNQPLATLPPIVPRNGQSSTTEPLLPQRSRFRYGTTDSHSDSEDSNPEVMKHKREKRAARRLLLSTNGVMLIISIMALDGLGAKWWLNVLLSFVVIFALLSICEVLTLKSSRDIEPRMEFEMIYEGTAEVKGVLTLALILLLILHAVIMSVFTVFEVSERTFAGENVMEVAVRRCKDWSQFNDVGVSLPWDTIEECEDLVSRQLKWEIAGCSILYVGIVTFLSWKLSKLRLTIFYDTGTEIES